MGDEFGPIGGVAGSDSLMMVDALSRAPVVSVGVEPSGVPEGVMHLGGGPARFAGCSTRSSARRADHRVPRIDPDPAWVLPLPPADGQDRVAEALGCARQRLGGERVARGGGRPGTPPRCFS